MRRREHPCVNLHQRVRRHGCAALQALTTLVVLAACGGASTGSNDGTAARVLWQRATPPTQIGDGIPSIAALATGVFFGYFSTLTAMRPRDGAVLWQRRGGAGTATPTGQCSTQGNLYTTLARHGNTLWATASA